METFSTFIASLPFFSFFRGADEGGEYIPHPRGAIDNPALSLRVSEIGRPRTVARLTNREDNREKNQLPRSPRISRERYREDAIALVENESHSEFAIPDDKGPSNGSDNGNNGRSRRDPRSNSAAASHTSANIFSFSPTPARRT